MRSVSQGRGPDGMDHIGIATNKSFGEWNTKSTTGKPEAEVPIRSAYVNDIRTVNITSRRSASMLAVLWTVNSEQKYLW